ncbi:MAG: cupin [Desulfobacteraceae bacterium]|nr:MAG: cupin [Desulfobacteraceae bacterium]
MKQLSILFIALFVLPVSTAASSGVPYNGDGHALVNTQDLKWSPVASMAPGAQMAIIEGDLSEEAPFTFRLKLPANYRLAPHIHPAYERVTVLSGTLHFAQGREFDSNKTTELKQSGMAIMAPGEPMFGFTEEETVIQLHGTGPWGIEYINPKDDPRK